MRTIGEARAGHRDLVAGLSRAVPDGTSEAAAAAVLGAPRPEEVFAKLYPSLLRHKTLPLAIGHLVAAGADPDGMAIPASTFMSTYPLNRLLPATEEAVSMGRLLDLLGRHAEMHRTAVRDLAAACGEGRLLLTTGQAWSAAYPEHPRWSADADLAAPDLEAGLDALGTLVGPMGFAMHGCRLALFPDSGSGLFKAFRVSDGFEINVSVLAAGPASSLTAIPLFGLRAVLDRARPVEWDGVKVLVASPADLLLETALRPLREGKVHLRAVNDARFLMEREGDGLDWDHIVRTARVDGTASALNRLARAAEAQAGRALMPQPVRADLALGGHLIFDPFPDSRAGGRLGRLRSSTAHRLWKLRSLRAELGGAAAAFHLTADPSRRRALATLAAQRSPGVGERRGLMEKARRAAAGATPARYRSVCELRAGPAPQAVGPCLSRDSARTGPPHWLSGRARQVLADLERSMPDAGEEAAFGKRGDGSPHRCDAFLVDLVRSPPPLPRTAGREDLDFRGRRESRWSSRDPEDAIWFMRDIPAELAAAVVAPGVAGGRRALDVGCGPGVATGFLAERFPVAVGFDLALGAVQLARARTDGQGARPRYAVARSPELPFRDGSFSFVFERGVLHHIPLDRWEQYQAAVARVLQPGGLFLQFHPKRPLPPVASLRGIRTRVRRALRWGLSPRTGPAKAMTNAAASLETIDVHRVPARPRQGERLGFTVVLFRKPGPDLP